MRKVIRTAVFEIIALLACIWLLEVIGYLDFVADGSWDFKLIKDRYNITAVLGSALMLSPPLLQYLGFHKIMKVNAALKPSSILNGMLFSTLRGWVYFLAIYQWNIFALQEYIGHCSQ